MEYIVNWAYRSGYGGPWQQGDRVTLTDEIANAINRDSPGVLSKTFPPGDQDRMIKSSRTRGKKETQDGNAT